MAVLLALSLVLTVALDPGPDGTIPPPYAPPADEMPVDAPEEVVEIVPTLPAVRAVWDRLAQCESSGNWHIATGNGYSGGLQFDAPTWRRYGGTAYASAAYLASREAQVAVAERTLQSQGWAAWPACSRKLGLR
jgi:hypothetical protein